MIPPFTMENVALVTFFLLIAALVIVPFFEGRPGDEDD